MLGGVVEAEGGFRGVWRWLGVDFPGLWWKRRGGFSGDAVGR